MNISVVLPTRNRQHLLARAVSSVLRQSYTGHELIIVDDGSEEPVNLSGFLRGTSLPWSMVRLDAGCGVARARNAGVAAARGQWIAFIDSDDEWHPKKLEKQVRWSDANPSYRIVQTREIWIRHGTRVNPPRTHTKKGGDLFEQSLLRCMITPSSVMIQKSLFNEAGGFNESLPACEDYELWLRITAVHQIGLVDEYLLTRYGGHADQLSRTVPVLDRFRVRALLDLLSGRTPLSDTQRSRAMAVLTRKALILAQGYRKRGKVREYERYHRIAREFAPS